MAGWDRGSQGLESREQNTPAELSLGVQMQELEVPAGRAERKSRVFN